LGVAATVLGLAALALGGAPPERAAAYVVCEDDECVHENIVGYAAYIARGEFAQHLLTVQDGAEHEDLHDHVWDISSPCTTNTHFWDADDPDPNNPMDSSPSCNSPNAWQKAHVLWGMALGEYHTGDLASAYEYLGHVTHLLADMTVPAHAHEETHVFADAFEDWMTTARSELAPSELDQLVGLGPIEIPEGMPALDWLFYTTNQVGDFYADDQTDGDSADPRGWASEFLAGLEDVAECRSEDGFELGDCDLAVVRRNVYFHAIRAVAALLELFDTQRREQAELTVALDTVKQLQGHGPTDDPDYYARVGIGGQWYRNEGNQVEVCTDCQADLGWAFARDVGRSGATEVWIELWDSDPDTESPDDLSDLHTDEGEDRRLYLAVDLAKCASGAPDAITGDLVGACGTQLTSAGDDEDRSQIWLRILAPNSPPTADAGPDQTVIEADAVTLTGTFTDPDVADTHTQGWELVDSVGDNCVDVPATDSATLQFTPIDDCTYTLAYTVTDNHGAQGTDTVTVTAENADPVVGIDRIVDETGAVIGEDVPVALVGLVVDAEGRFTDVGPLDTHSATLDWGDGTVAPDGSFVAYEDCLGGNAGSFVGRHAYGATGDYWVQVAVTDDDAGVGTDSAQIAVVDASGAVAAVVDSLEPLSSIPDVSAALDRLRGERGGVGANGAIAMFEQGTPYVALEMIQQAIGFLTSAEEADSGLDFTHEKGLLALAAKSAALEVVEAAQAVATQPALIAKVKAARALMEQGDALLAQALHQQSVKRYQEAVRAVQGIS
jgi:hypothetical protein